MERTRDHIHRYYRAVFKTSKTIIYRCSREGCPHFLHEPLIVGRFCECYRCGKNFVITKKTLHAKRLHCENCTRGKYNKPLERSQIVIDVESTLDGIFDSLNLNSLLEKGEGEKHDTES